MRKLLPLLLCFACITAAAQHEGLQTRMFSVAEMQSDIDTMYKWVTETHPSLYTAVEKGEADKKWKQVRSSINRPMNRVEFVRKILPLLTQYRDGHTGLTPEFDFPEFETYKKTGGKLLPLRVLIAKDRIWCVENYQDNGLVSPGDEILSIHGKPAKQIIQDLLPVWPADDLASNEVIVTRLFSYTLWLYYGWGNGSPVELKKSNGKVSVTLKGMDPDTYLNRYFSAMQSWKLELFPAGQLAVITSGAYNTSEAKTRRFLDSAFNVIRNNNISNVAFDIRNNGGGNSTLGRMLLGYVFQKPSTSIYSKTFRSSPMLETLPPDSWLAKAYATAKKNWKAVPDGYMLDIAPQEAMIPENKDLLFKGKFYLLTSARTFSSAHMTAMEVKCYGIGTIIGEPTGERMDLSGEVTGFALPNTKLEGILPTARFTTACGNGKIVGVQPDIYVKVTTSHLFAGKDPVMEKLMSLCR